MVAYTGKCHLLINFKVPVDVHISKTKALNEEKVNLLVLNDDFIPT